MKVALGSPIFDQCQPAFVTALLETLDALRGRGHAVIWGYVAAKPVHLARNEIAAAHLGLGAEVSIQVDVDCAWSPKDVVTAVEAIGSGLADVIGFPFASRQPEAREFTSPRLIAKDDEVVGSGHRVPLRGFVHQCAAFVEVDVVGGLLVVSRKCLEQLSATAPGTPPALFDFSRTASGRAVGEDAHFCRAWRAMGGRVFCAIDAKTAHVGRATFSSDFAQAIGSLPIEWDPPRVVEEPPTDASAAAE